MKKFTKRLMTSALTATMAISMIGGLNVSAIDCKGTATSTQNTDVVDILNDNGFRNCANAIINNSELMGIDGDMYNAVIGESYSIATVHSDMSVESNNDNIFFPVISEDNIVGIISATKINGDYHFSASEGIADELNAKMAESTKFALVTDESGNVYTVETDGTIDVLAVEDETNVEDYALSFDDVDDYNNVISDTIFSTDGEKLTNWYSGSRAVTTNILSDYPCIKQSGNTCWAYTILSMTRYKFGNTVSIGDVFGAFIVANGNPDTENGATLDEAYNTIDYLFTYIFKDDNENYSPVKTSSKISAQQIVNNITQDLPIYIRGKRTATDGSTVGHAVALVGYERDGSSLTGIYVMNAQDGAIAYNEYSNPNCYFESGTGAYKYLWNGTVTLKGTL